MGENEKDCIFCQKENFEHLILAESADARIVLNRFPSNIEGHSMVIAKHHYENFINIDASVFAGFCGLAQKVASRFLKEGKDFVSMRVVIMEGKEAGASIRHFHIHVIPLKKDEPPPLPRKPGESRKEVAEEAIKKFKRLFENF